MTYLRILLEIRLEGLRKIAESLNTAGVWLALKLPESESDALSLCQPARNKKFGTETLKADTALVFAYMQSHSYLFMSLFVLELRGNSFQG
jgi:hypothetical protein